jgi:hypothetical protein
MGSGSQHSTSIPCLKEGYFICCVFKFTTVLNDNDTQRIYIHIFEHIHINCNEMGRIRLLFLPMIPCMEKVFPGRKHCSVHCTYKALCTLEWILPQTPSYLEWLMSEMENVHPCSRHSSDDGKGRMTCLFWTFLYKGICMVIFLLVNNLNWRLLLQLQFDLSFPPMWNDIVWLLFISYYPIAVKNVMMHLADIRHVIMSEDWVILANHFKLKVPTQPILFRTNQLKGQSCAWK